jgi:hypothetical protein
VSRVDSTQRTRRLVTVALAVIAVVMTSVSVLSTASANTSAARMPAPAVTSDAQTAGTTAAPVSVAPLANAAIAADYSSIFADQAPGLAGSGWATCPTPVTWSVDFGSLSPEQSDRELASLQWAFEQWAQASGLAFAYGGTQHLRYDSPSSSLAPADGSAIPSRHIYLAFVSGQVATLLDGGTVGLGSPTRVVSATKEIVDGSAVFRTDHVASATTAEGRSLYLHEIGHVLGLAHAHDSANLMFSVVTDDIELGAGDVNGVRAMVKPCAQAA